MAVVWGNLAEGMSDDVEFITREFHRKYY